MRFYSPLHFTIQELVPPEIFKAKGEQAILGFDPRILWTIDKIREYYDKPVYINNWDMKTLPKGAEKFTQRGLRTKFNPKTPLSQHYYGRAIDFTIQGVSAIRFRQDARVGALESVLVYVTRIEEDTTWNHIDCANVPGRDIIFFKGKK